MCCTDLGNVHDSHGARDFILACIATVRAALRGSALRCAWTARFSAMNYREPRRPRGGQTASVPFERFAELKARIEARRWWWPLGGCPTSKRSGNAKAWNVRHRFLFIRTRVNEQFKDPVQLDFFIFSHRIEATSLEVILRQERLEAARYSLFQHRPVESGRLFAELKSDNQLDDVPTRTWVGNRSTCSRRSSPTTSAASSR